MLSSIILSSRGCVQNIIIHFSALPDSSIYPWMCRDSARFDLDFQLASWLVFQCISLSNSSLKKRYYNCSAMIISSRVWWTVVNTFNFTVWHPINWTTLLSSILSPHPALYFGFRLLEFGRGSYSVSEITVSYRLQVSSIAWSQDSFLASTCTKSSTHVYKTTLEASSPPIELITSHCILYILYCDMFCTCVPRICIEYLEYLWACRR